MGRPAPHYPGWIVRSARPQSRRPMLRDREQSGRSLRPARCDSGTRARAGCGSRRCRTPTMSRRWHSSPMARSLAAGDFNGLVRLWDTSTGREIGRPLPQGEIVLSLAYSPDGKMLAVGLASDRTGKPGIRLWDTTDTPTHRRITAQHGCTSPGSNSGRMVGPCSRVPARSARTRLWDTTRGQAIGEPMIDEAVRRIPSRRSCLPHAGKGRHGQAPRCRDRSGPRQPADRLRRRPPVRRFAAMAAWSPRVSRTARSGSATRPRRSRSARRGP